MANYTLVQISDVHLTTEGALPNGARPRENLVASLEWLERSVISPDALVLTGDLANEGDPDCYRDLAGLVASAAQRLQSQVIWVPGNHDRRRFFREVLLGEEPNDAPINRTYDIDGLRIVTLDSNIEGEDGGELGGDALEFLAAELASPARFGTVVALHHPPIPSPVEPMARIALKNPESLAEALAESDVRLVVCGHNHHAGMGLLGGLPVWVSPATAYLCDTASTKVFRPIPGTAMSRIDLTPGQAVASVIAVEAPSPQAAPALR
jgi:Icc protein